MSPKGDPEATSHSAHSLGNPRHRCFFAARVDGAGRLTGGTPFSRGQLYKMLSNPIYAGRLSHKGNTYEGQHPAILDNATWASTQAKLASHRHHRGARQLASEHLLVGRIKDDRGHAMTPTHAQKGSRRYRYYVSQAMLQGRADHGSVPRLPAPEIEAMVIDALRAGRPNSLGQSERELIVEHLHQVTIYEGWIEIATNAEDEAPIRLPWCRASAQRRREIVLPTDSDAPIRPMKVEHRARILKRWRPAGLGSTHSSPARSPARTRLRSGALQRALDPHDAVACFSLARDR